MNRKLELLNFIIEQKLEHHFKSFEEHPLGIYALDKRGKVVAYIIKESGECRRGNTYRRDKA